MKIILNIVVILLILLIILGVSYYVFYRLWHILPAGKTVLIAVAVTLVLCFFLGFFGGYFLPTPLATITYHVGMTFFFVALYLLIIFLMLDLLRLVVPMQKILFNNWYTFVILMVTLTAVFTYGHLNYRKVVRVEQTISIDKEISPLKIVAISDLHLGFAIGHSYLERWVDLINRENPDIVLITGDIVDNFMKPIIEQNMAATLKKINSRFGVFACLGNHEYIGGKTKFFKTLDFLNDANINVLRDTSTLINNEFYLIGRDDLSMQNRKSLADLLKSVDTSKPLILLDHQPLNLNEPVQHNIDLQISGHTHRGQLPPFSWITDKMFEVSHGHTQKENTHIHVTSGLGIWGGKFRIGTQSEYVVIVLKTKFNNK